MEETPSYGLSHSHQPKDHCVQLAPALRDHEVTFSLAQRSLCPVGTCVEVEWRQQRRGRVDVEWSTVAQGRQEFARGEVEAEVKVEQKESRGRVEAEQ